MKRSLIRRIAVPAVVAMALVFVLAVGSCGGSSAPSPSPTAANGQQTSAYGAAMEAAMRMLAVGVQSYYEDNGSYPTAVTQATVGSYISPWPTDPWTHQPIAEGKAMGDFTYVVGLNGFQLVGHLADGKYVLAP
jgi:hypothetical protein